MRRIAILAAIALLLLPALAAASNPHFKSELLIEHTTADTDAFSRWITSPMGLSVIWCELDRTGAVGGGTVVIGIMQCKAENIIAAGCVDNSDAVIWATGNTVAIVDTDILRLSARPAVNDPTSAADKEVSGPLPSRWAIFGDEAGSNTTLEYTIHCTWW